MTSPTGIDTDAPVRAHHETDINAPLETVWRLQTDVNSWPAWQTEITAARLNGPFQPGSSFTWTSYGLTVTSTIYAVAERARTLWGGTPKASPEPTNGPTSRHPLASTSPRRNPSLASLSSRFSFVGSPTITSPA
jgi:hypothetical protein